MPIIKTYTSNEEAYRELKNVEYLQSNNAQVIDSGINQKYSEKVKIEFDIMPTSLGGYYGGNGTTQCPISNGYGFKINVKSHCEILHNKNSTTTVITDGVLKDTYTFSGYDNIPICFFALGVGTKSYSDYTNSKLYGAKIYDGNDELIRDFQPVVLNNVGYLYDRVEHKLYGNDGTGSFTYGSILDITINPQDTGWVDRTIIDGKLSLNAIAKTGYEFQNWLLKGYTRLEYIESSRTQYIDTGFSPNQDTRIYLKGKNFEGLADNGCLYGVFSGARVDVWEAGDGDFWFSYENQLDVFGKASLFNSYPFTIDLNKNIFTATYGQNQDIYTKTFAYRNFTMVNNRTMCLFALNNSGSITGRSKYALEMCKIYDNGTLVRDYIPVFRHSDGAIGLLDLVNLKFYGNSGTGNFIGGEPL